MSLMINESLLVIIEKIHKAFHSRAFTKECSLSDVGNTCMKTRLKLDIVAINENDALKSHL